MTGPDDYEDMKLFGRLSDRDIDRLLDGRVSESAEDLDDLARHLGGLKRVQAHVREDVADRQIAQIVHTSKRLRQAGWSAPAASHGIRRGRSMQKRLALLTAKIGAVLVGASMLTVGMAFAGVTLPDAVNDAFESAGVTLPNQATDALLNAQGQPEDLPGQLEVEGEGSETSQAVLSVIDTWTGERDCFFGLAVASAASGEERDTSPCEQSELATTEAEGSKATGDEASGGASTAGSDNATTAGQDGRETAGAKSGGASTAGSDNAGTAGDAGSHGQETGSEASEKGSSNQDKAPSGGQPDDEE